jgi:hypothetical protein
MECTTESLCQNWEIRMVQNALTLYQSIWTNRNTFLHGNSWKESKEKLRERVIDAVLSFQKDSVRCT